MHLLFLIVTGVHAAVPPICKADLSDHSVPVSGGPLRAPPDLAERAIRPGLIQVQEDTCRCLPKRRKHRPDRVRATLHIKPNAGTMRLAYTVEPMGTPLIGQMLACMGQPELTFEPMVFVSDIVYSDGTRGNSLRYPVLFEMDNEPPRKRRVQRKK